MKIDRCHCLLLLTLALATLPPALADTKVTMEEGTGVNDDDAEMPEEMRQAFANQGSTTAVYWITEDMAARIDDSVSVVGRLDRGEAYFVSGLDKSYTVVPLDGREGSSTGTSVSEWVNTGESRKIGSWKAVDYRLDLDRGGKLQRSCFGSVMTPRIEFLERVAVVESIEIN